LGDVVRGAGLTDDGAVAVFLDGRASASDFFVRSFAAVPRRDVDDVDDGDDDDDDDGADGAFFFGCGPRDFVDPGSRLGFSFLVRERRAERDDDEVGVFGAMAAPSLAPRPLSTGSGDHAPLLW
jgi:hypothetical protein